MGYTLSFDASAKCGKADIRGLLHHIAREVDRQNGREVRHSNQDINAARTGDNETWVSDGSGGFQRCKKIEDIENALYDRLSHVKNPLRKDAVVLRPLILQLDPEWYDSHQNEDERNQAANDMLDWAIKTFGMENIMYATLHQDEWEDEEGDNHPHLHIGFCPVTADGRLSQKDWFRSPATLRQMHDDFRKHMATRDYDIQMDRKKPGKYAKRMSVGEYKDFAELQKAQKAMEAREKALKAQERALRVQATNIGKMLQEAQETLSECNQYKRTIAEQQQARKLAARQKKIAERVADADALLSGLDGSSPNISLR